MPANGSYGCEMADASNYLHYSHAESWLPYTFTPNITTFVHVQVALRLPFHSQIRHTLDPYITAGLLTDACSSSSTTGANCFGRSKSDDLRVALVRVALGATGVLAIVVVSVLRRCEAQIHVVTKVLEKKGKPVPAWMTPLRLLQLPCGRGSMT